MFGIKTIFRQSAKAFLLKRAKTEKFPSQPISAVKIKKVIQGLGLELTENSNTPSLDSPSPSYANITAVQTWKKLIHLNPNNLGNWVGVNKPSSSLTEIEAEVISQLLNLYQVSANNFTGYISSGSTEGNLMGSWLGRNYLSQYVSSDKIALLQTDLTHYSIAKCADIIGVKTHIVHLSWKTWAMDEQGFEQTVLDLYKKGCRGFLVPLTLGYTASGTNDSVEKICRKINQLKKKKKGLHFFVWLDAAFSGLILPFTQKSFKPFQNKEVQLITVDFHKFAGVPFPASAVLYRKNLSKLIQRNIPYLEQKDATVLGSRPGVAAVAIWATIQSLGFSGFKKMIKKSLSEKSRFLKQISQSVPQLTIISDPNSVQALIMPGNKKIPAEICKRHGLVLRTYNLHFSDKTRKVKYYKLFFLPFFKSR